MATEIVVENIEPVGEVAGAASVEPDLVDPPEVVQEPPHLEREVTAEPPAPKRRGRPPKQRDEPVAAPKRRGRPPKARIVEEPVYEEPVAEPPPVDINALLAPLMQAYMANNHLQQRQLKSQQRRQMVRSIFSRQRVTQTPA